MTRSFGLEAIARVFSRAHQEDRAVLIPYVTLGYPSLQESLTLAEAAIEGGADLLELGIPFSDPLADGPTIQRATHEALEQGTTVRQCIELAGELRARHPETPLLFMGYTNPMMAFGEEGFCRACRNHGIDGLIVPDLPLEESACLKDLCDAQGMALVLLAAPNSSDVRLEEICQRSTGYVYLVSVTGITGARQAVPSGLAEFVGRARSVTDKPLAVGFGVSTPEIASAVGRIADGVIVGSAIVSRCAGSDASRRVRDFVNELSSALR